MEKRNFPSIYEEEFLKYLQEKGRNHHSYKMYTTIDIVNSTIEKEALYLSNGDNWNDRIDSAVYGIQRSPFCFKTVVFRNQRPPFF